MRHGFQEDEPEALVLARRYEDVRHLQGRMLVRFAHMSQQVNSLHESVGTSAVAYGVLFRATAYDEQVSIGDPSCGQDFDQLCHGLTGYEPANGNENECMLR